MLMVLKILISAMAIVQGWLFARRFVAQGYSLNSSLRVQDSMALLGILIGLSGWIGCFFFLHAHPGALWVFPEWVELVHQDFFEAGFLFAVVFLCVAVAVTAWLQGKRGAWVPTVFSMAALCCYLGYSWHRQQPIADQLGNKTREGVILQTSGVSCAAAATANVLNALGENRTEREMAALLQTTSSGTLSTQVAVTARELGFDADRFFLQGVQWERAPAPSVIFVDHPATGPESHAVSLMGFADEMFEVWDPLVGRRFFSISDLAAIWHGRGIAIRRMNDDEQI